MESNNECRRDSVENIGAIVDFEEEEDDSDLEANELANSLNHIINISSDELKPKKQQTILCQKRLIVKKMRRLQNLNNI